MYYIPLGLISLATVGFSVRESRWLGYPQLYSQSLEEPVVVMSHPNNAEPIQIDVSVVPLIHVRTRIKGRERENENLCDLNLELACCGLKFIHLSRHMSPLYIVLQHQCITHA